MEAGEGNSLGKGRPEPGSGKCVQLQKSSPRGWRVRGQGGGGVLHTRPEGGWARLRGAS